MWWLNSSTTDRDDTARYQHSHYVGTGLFPRLTSSKSHHRETVHVLIRIFEKQIWKFDMTGFLVIHEHPNQTHSSDERAARSDDLIWPRWLHHSKHALGDDKNGLWRTHQQPFFVSWMSIQAPPASECSISAIIEQSRVLHQQSYKKFDSEAVLFGFSSVDGQLLSHDRVLECLPGLEPNNRASSVFLLFSL